MTTGSGSGARRGRFARCAPPLLMLTVAALLGVTGCSPADTPPTTIPSPAVSNSVPSSAEWGSFDSREDACFGVASDVLTLALVPNNLALADPVTGVGDIENTVTAAGSAAPPSVAREYRQLATIVRTYGVELAEWSERAAAAATPTATPGSSGAPGGSGTDGSSPRPTPDSSSEASSPTASGSPTPTSTAAPARPAFDAAPFSARLDAIKTWLSDTCG